MGHNKETGMKQNAKLKTTLGELIYALSEETGRVILDEKTKYRVVAYMLRELLDPSKVGRTEAFQRAS